MRAGKPGHYCTITLLALRTEIHRNMETFSKAKGYGIPLYIRTVISRRHTECMSKFKPALLRRLFVNLETTEKVYKGSEHMCPMDGFVCFHNSELMCGRLGKATLGGGNKSSLFQVSSCLRVSAKSQNLQKLSHPPSLSLETMYA